MIRGMYEAAASMVTSMTRLVRLGNNLANVTTPGFKQDLSAPVSFKEMMLARTSADGTTAHAIGSGSPVDEHAELIAEQGDTLSILITGADGPRTVALTILSPTAGVLTITAGAACARCVVALLGLPASHHDH